VTALHPQEIAPATETAMKRARWLRKALWITTLVVLLLSVAALIGLRVYLSSQGATRQVAEHLQELLGGRVEVQGADIGLTGDSSVRGIEAFADGDNDKPWLRIDEVKTDVSALSLLRGQSPDAIQLTGARIVLRFADDGHLLTKLPSGKKGAAPTKLPRLHIDNGELTLDQEHRSPMILSGLTADIASGDDGVTLTGTVADRFWGDWKVSGDMDSAAGKSSITLDTDKLAVTMPKLQAIAFIPPSVWKSVHIEGTTPARVRLDMTTAGANPSVRYRVEVKPRDAHIQVPAIDLDATQASGKVVVADEIVTLEDVRGKTAGGAITTSGKLNFRDEPTRLIFKAGVEDVVLSDLPRSWKLGKLKGKLTGKADVVVTIGRGKVETAGSGVGVIRDAILPIFGPVKEPIQLAMRSDGRRFDFHLPKSGAISDRNARPTVPVSPTPPTELRPGSKVSRYGPDAETSDQGQSRDKETKPPGEGAAPQPRIGAAVVGRAPERQEKKQADAGDFLQDAPAELVNLIGRGIQLTADGLAHGIDAAANALGKLKPPSKPGEEPTYLNVNLNLQNVDLARLVKKLDLNLPYAITGRLTFQVQAAIPVNTAGDLKAYRLNGTAKLPSFNMAGVELTDVEARVRYANGVLDLEDLHARMPQAKEAIDAQTAGKLDGKASVQVVPRGDFQATLQLDRVPLGVVLSLLPQAKGEAAGVLSGKVQARAPLEKLSDPATWRGSANLSAPTLELYGLTLSKTSASLSIEEARAKLTTLKADVAGAPLTGDGELQLKGDYPFKAEVHLGQADLNALNRLSPSFRSPVEIRGRAQLDGSIKGTLKPFAFDGSGRIAARDLMAEGFKVDDLSFNWLKDKNGLKINEIKADLYGGNVGGSALVPLSAAATGTANLRLRDVDMQAIAKSLPSFPIRLEGKVSGTVQGELATPKKGEVRAWTTDVELTAPKLRIQGIPAEKLTGSLASHGGKTSYDLKGESLGGTFSIKGTLPAAQEKDKKKSNQPVGQGGPDLLPVAAFAAADEPPGQGRLEIRDMRLSRLWAVYDITGGLAHLNGRFSLTLPYRHEGADLFPVGNGTFRIFDVRWDAEYLGDGLRGDARLTPNDLQLENINGGIGGGLLRGQFVFGFKANSRSWFQIELQQVEASRLLIPLPTVAAQIKGPVDLTVRGRIGREWDGNGGATLSRGQIYGMDITEWRIPLTFRFSPEQGSGELTVRDSHAHIAQGRARFESTLNWGNGLRLTGLLLFYQVDLRTLFRNSPTVSSYASGRVSGRVDLAGNEMRSSNDLTAIVLARMEQGQALQMPLLRQITPYLRPGVSSATFQSGNLKGRLAGGIFRIQHASLTGDYLKLLIQGTVNLAGNLNLDVIAQTGLYCLNPARNNAIRSRIPLIGAIPRLLLYEASSLLAAQVVHLRVTGTASSPSVHLEPILLMTEEAIRFFLNRAAGLAIPNLP
jgi:hypothetical protein